MTSCICDKCVSMCKHFPCLPTVADVKKIQAAGYSDKLAIYSHGGSVNHVRGKRNKDGSCAFLENDRCILHNAGLKPTEGREVDHNHGLPGWWYSKVFREWRKSFPQDRLNIDNLGAPL